ncbi:MAG TPA: riboflavin biosynthesis protein RibF [Bacteroidales bacterium]|nr:riboflavin biosynthesis protein RibF [Bacteroidales bacterium]
MIILLSGILSIKLQKLNYLIVPFSPALLILLPQDEINMIVHYEYENLNLRNPFVTVGVFDGVHLGHRALLERLVLRAREGDGESVVITFNPHPRLVLSEKKEEPFSLSTIDEKKELLELSGIDHLIIMNFTRELGNMDAADFIGEILFGKIGVKHLLVGYDNHFGKDKGGDFKKIRECSEMYNFEIEQVEGIYAQEGIISSTTIREALIQGRVEDAGRLLGYNYKLSGIVVEGRKIGHKLGFPTANIKPADIFKLIPADGVYAVEVTYSNLKFPGMLSIGYNPTVNNDRTQKSIEVNIFGSDADLYGCVITVIFRYRLREERKFKDTEHLAMQMKLDKEAALRLLD